MRRGKGPKRGTAAFRKLHRERMSMLRNTKILEGECRQCSSPAKIGPNGPMSACEKHLAEDAKRVLETRKRRKAGGDV